MFLMACVVLILGLLKPLPGMAQAEIIPDHFDLTTEQGLQGNFILLHQVNYAGLTLPAGVYSLSVISAGGWNLVTLTPEGTAAPVHARIKCPSTYDRPTALILERDGEQSVLTAISFEQPGTILRLQGRQSRPVSAEAEQVPVSYTPRSK
jgi:hypothetical protein